MRSFVILAFVLTLWCGGIAGAAEKRDSLANIFGFIAAEDENRSYTANYNFQNATAMLVQEKSGKLDTSYVICRHDKFSFTRLRPGKVYLKISHLSYKSEEGIYDIVPGDNVIYFTLKEKKEKIDEANVTAEVPLIHILQDTTIYNAAAIMTQEGENALELIKQLPGFSVGENSITVNGKRVARTYVNGVQIFGDNPVTAFKTLLADEVRQVRVYDKISEADRYKGLKVSDKERVLDIRTKDPVLSLAKMVFFGAGGADGTESATGNIQGRYAGYIGADFYSEMLTMKAAVDITNSRNQSMAEADGAEFVLSEMFEPSFSSYNENISAYAGINKYWKNREYGNSLSAKYTLDRTYTRSLSETLTEYFESDSSPAMSYHDSLSNSSAGITHGIEANLTLRNTKIKDISIGVSGSVSDNRSSGIRSTSNNVSDGSGRSQYGQSGTDGRNYNAGIYLSWSKNDNIRLIPSINISAGFSSNSDLSWDTDTLTSSFLRRQLQSDGIGKGIDVQANAGIQTYLVNNERLSLSANFSYDFNYENSRRRQMTYDFIELDGNGNPLLNIPNSYDYKWNTMTNYLTAGAKLSLRKVSFELGLRGGSQSQFDDEFFPEAVTYDRVYNFIEPRLAINFSRHFINFACTSSQPSITQTRDRIDDSNPLVLNAGNPDLKQTYAASANFAGTIFQNRKTGMTLGYKGNFTYYIDNIVSKSTYFTSDTHLDSYGGYDVKTGSMMYSYENASGGWRANFSFPYSALFRKPKSAMSLNMNITPSANVENMPQYAGNNLESLLTYNVSLGANFIFRYRKFSLTLTPDMSYFHSDNNLGQNITSGWRFTGRLKTGYMLPLKIFLSAEMTGTYYIYTSGIGYNTDICALQCSVDRSFLKNRLKVKLSAMDLLSKGGAYSTRTTSNYYRQTWNPTYGRYFILSLTYVVRQKTAKH